MPGNSFETDGRGFTDKQLFGCGVAMAAVIAVVSGTMLLKSTGALNDYTRVTADLMNVGDGLPKKSDVKYHGLLVGEVDGVEPAKDGKPNYVHIDLKPEFAKSIPGNATARVVPSNVFAVSSVQLVDRGPGAPIRAGAHIEEDTQLPTVLFQTTVSKLRDLLQAEGRDREDHSVGIMAALGAATDNRRVKLLNAGAQLNRLIDQLNSIVATDDGPSTVSALLNATEGLKQTAPELLDSLQQAVKPMQTFAEKREQLKNLLSAGLQTVGTTRTAFNNHTDQLIGITTNLTPVIGSFAQHADRFLPGFQKLKNMNDKWFQNPWMSDLDTGNMRVSLSLTPGYSYTRADCPHYGEMKGPSCYTAPEQVVRPDLPDVLLPQNYQPPPDLAPPSGTVIGPDGNLIAKGYPYQNPNPDLHDPNPPLPWWQPVPVPRVPGSANPDDLEPPPPGPDPKPIAPVAPNPNRPVSYGGNVGPVGSEHERVQLAAITGQPPNAATDLLLGPVARGNIVTVAKKEEAPR